MKILIAELRKQRGLTQAELAAQAGISRPFLAQIETGERNLSLKNQRSIAQALGVKPTELVDFDASMNDEKIISEAFASLSVEQRQVLLELAKSILRAKTDSEQE
jgi:transcriptional regulator with XRE-family HTH domain